MKLLIKKTIIYFSILLLFMIFNNSTTKAAKNELCKVSQGTTSYDMYFPFYIYKIEKEYAMMSNLNEYSLTTTVIENSTQCSSIYLQSSDSFKDRYGYSYLNTVYYVSQNQNNSSNENKYTLATSQFTTTSELSAFMSGGTTQYGALIKGTYISLDNTPPQIIQKNWSGAYITNINSPVTVHGLKLLIRGYDETDGEVTTYIIEDNYSQYKNTIGGPYNITYGAKDSAGNEGTLTVQVYVTDTTEPSISGASEYTNNMSNPIDIQNIKQNLKATDNYDTNPEITVKEDNWSDNKNNKGTYKITFIATDSSNNASQDFVVSITNIDDIAPVIRGENTYNVSNSSQISLDYILSQLEITDNIKQTLTPSIENNTYSPNKTTVGTYYINISVTDEDNNKSDPFTINIHVFDNIAPVFYVSSNFIAVETNTKLTVEQLKKIIAQANNIDYEETSLATIDYDDYSSNYQNEGTHIVTLTYTFKDGKQKIIEQNIKVIDSTKIEIPTTNEQTNVEQQPTKSKNNIFAKIWKAITSFFTNVWKKIKYLFSFKWL